jgi:hypothetical protein
MVPNFFDFFCCTLTTQLNMGSFSEESDKIGRGFIKILETWQFCLSFNIIRHIFDGMNGMNLSAQDPIILYIGKG